MNIIDYVINDRSAMNHVLYSSRIDAAEKMVEFVSAYNIEFNALIYIPMGGEPIKDVFIKKYKDLICLACPVVKIPSSLNNKFGIGALDLSSKPLFNTSALKTFNTSQSDVEFAIDASMTKQEFLLRSYKLKTESFMQLKSKDVLVVDDGLSSGYTMQATLSSITAMVNVKNLCCLVPVASMEGVRLLRNTFPDVNVFSLYYDNSALFFVDLFYKNFEDIR
jgi:predicted phosphoribosyltransferase